MSRHPILSLICFVGLFFGICSTLWGQQVRVEGFVVDREENPVVFANVHVVGTTYGAATDLKGAYRFSMPATQDSITIRFSCIGYRTVERHFPKGITTKTKLIISLPEEATEIGTVVVTAERQQRELNLETVKPSEIKRLAGPTGGVEAMITTFAGVSQSNELSAQYSVRGGSYDENMVYVNGLEVYRPLLVRTAQQEGLSFINPDLTEAVNFSAGGFSTEYGDKMSSVLDIRYKQPKKTEASIELGLQSDNLYIGTRHKALSQATGIRFKSGKALASSLETKAEYEPYYFDAQTYWSFKPSNKWQFSLLGNYAFTHYLFRPVTRETSFGTISNAKKLKVFFDGQERDRFTSYYTTVQATYLPNERWKHSLAAAYYHSSERETYDIESAYYLEKADPNGAGETPDNPLGKAALATGGNLEHARNRLTYSIASLSWRTMLLLRQRHTLRFGADLRGERVDDHIAEWTLRDSAGYNQPRHPDRIEMLHNLYSDNQLVSWRASGFVQGRLRYDLGAGQLTMVPGVRVAYHHFNKEFIASPRFIFSFVPERQPDLSLRATTGLYYQAPFYKEARCIEADPFGNKQARINHRIRSQGSWQLLLGVDYQFLFNQRRFRFTAEAYGKLLFRMNPYWVENVRVRYLGENVAKGYVAGLDLKLFGEFVPEVDSWLTVSLIHSKLQIPDLGSMPLPNAPTYNISLFFQDYFPQFRPISLTLRGVASGGLPVFRPSARFDLPAFTGKPYRRVDIGILYEFYNAAERRGPKWLNPLRSASVAVELFNLFNHYNVSGYFWVTDAHHRQFAVPNYLTGRMLNVKFAVSF